MKKLLYFFLAITVACSSGDDSSDNNNPPANCDVVYLDANGVTIKACPNAQIGDTGNVNGFTYTIVSEQQLRDYVDSDYPDLNRLVTTQVTDMTELFREQYNFNQDISSWDVSNVTSMGSMFYDTAFNQPIGNWDVSNVTNMWGMFVETSLFNQDISGWDVSSVTFMYEIFDYAPSFNQPLNNWNVSSVTDMEEMFAHAKSFNQSLDNWDVSKDCITAEFISGGIIDYPFDMD